MAKESKGMKRRDFMVTGIGGATALGVLKSSGIAGDGAVESKVGRGKMTWRKLGDTGVKLPIMSMGVMNAQNPELIKRAYELGVRHFDTAAVYQMGMNEKMLGKAIEELGVRKDVVIATKVHIPGSRRGSMTAEEVKNYFLETVERSLKSLRTNYIDILYVHNVSDPKYLENPGIIEAMKTLKKQKKILYPGYTTHTHMEKVIAHATKMDLYRVVETTFNYSLHLDKSYYEVLKKAAASGVGIIAMKTQCNQPWYKQRLPGNIQKYYEGEINHQALLKWVVRHDFICTAIPGVTTFKQIEDDVNVARNLDYTPAEKSFIQDKNVKLAMNSVCQICEKCVASCPSNVDIPNLIRAHMYTDSYSNYTEARQTLANIDGKRGLDRCVSCDSCVATCRRNVDIKGRIAELKYITNLA